MINSQGGDESLGHAISSSTCPAEIGTDRIRHLQDTQASPTQLSPREWAKLIQKLRWIGLEDEARSLQLAARTLSPEERGSVLTGPFSTD